MPDMDGFVRMSLPILLSSAVMGAASYGAYCGLCLFVSPKLAVIPAIVLAVAVYAVSIVLFKAVTYDDVAMLPRGEQLARLLHVKKKVLPRHKRSSR